MQSNDLLSQSIAEFFARDTLLPVILCIGSDKVTGDALGPVAGELLTKRYALPCFVYGTLASTVTALNLETTLAFIRHKHPSRRILAVDSGLGGAAQTGKLKFFSGGVKPGRGVGKELPLVGDFSVLGIVADKKDAHLLSAVPLGAVYRLAETAARSVARGIYLIARSKRDADASLPSTLL